MITDLRYIEKFLQQKICKYITIDTEGRIILASPSSWRDVPTGIEFENASRMHVVYEQKYNDHPILVLVLLLLLSPLLIITIWSIL